MSRVSESHRPILIRGGRVLDPASGRDEVVDVYLADGKVQDVGPRLAGQVGRKAERVDAKGHWVMPFTSLGHALCSSSKKIPGSNSSSVPAPTAPLCARACLEQPAYASFLF